MTGRWRDLGLKNACWALKNTSGAMILLPLCLNHHQSPAIERRDPEVTKSITLPGSAYRAPFSLLWPAMTSVLVLGAAHTQMSPGNQNSEKKATEIPYAINVNKTSGMTEMMTR